ncbi:hypothetical protein Trydic_g2311 [Trypoxylus dichotomus]
MNSSGKGARCKRSDLWSPTTRALREGEKKVGECERARTTKKYDGFSRVWVAGGPGIPTAIVAAVSTPPYPTPRAPHHGYNRVSYRYEGTRLSSKRRHRREREPRLSVGEEPSFLMWGRRFSPFVFSLRAASAAVSASDAGRWIGSRTTPLFYASDDVRHWRALRRYYNISRIGYPPSLVPPSSRFAKRKGETMISSPVPFCYYRKSRPNRITATVYSCSDLLPSRNAKD